jgi:hypothetical protein
MTRATAGPPSEQNSAGGDRPEQILDLGLVDAQDPQAHAVAGQLALGYPATDRARVAPDDLGGLLEADHLPAGRAVGLGGHVVLSLYWCTEMVI